MTFNWLASWLPAPEVNPALNIVLLVIYASCLWVSCWLAWDAIVWAYRIGRRRASRWYRAFRPQEQLYALRELNKAPVIKVRVRRS